MSDQGARHGSLAAPFLPPDHCRRSRKVRLSPLLLLILTGCASGPQFTRAGSTVQDYTRSIAQCRVQGAMTSRTGDALWDGTMQMQTVKNCMIGQGWSPA